jgi:hypothetical protein
MNTKNISKQKTSRRVCYNRKDRFKKQKDNNGKNIRFNY